MSLTTGASIHAANAQAYASVGIESDVMSASPHRLIAMLFDGLLLSIRKARLHMINGNQAEKGKAISHAIDILNQGLRAALDKEKGGEVAEGLASIYDYCARLLLEANLHNSVDKLEEATRLLDSIGSAWREIAGQ